MNIETIINPKYLFATPSIESMMVQKATDLLDGLGLNYALKIQKVSVPNKTFLSKQNASISDYYKNSTGVITKEYNKLSVEYNSLYKDYIILNNYAHQLLLSKQLALDELANTKSCNCSTIIEDSKYANAILELKVKQLANDILGLQMENASLKKTKLQKLWAWICNKWNTF